jgi:hypothetical protein
MACGTSLFSSRLDDFHFTKADLNELNLPPQAFYLTWTLPIVDLHTMNLSVEEVRKFAPCEPRLKIVEGRLYGYE